MAPCQPVRTRERLFFGAETCAGLNLKCQTQLPFCELVAHRASLLGHHAKGAFVFAPPKIEARESGHCIRWAVLLHRHTNALVRAIVSNPFLSNIYNHGPLVIFPRVMMWVLHPRLVIFYSFSETLRSRHPKSNPSSLVRRFTQRCHNPFRQRCQ